MNEPEARRTHVIERTFDAPAALVFAAYSEPAHLFRWFGPRGYPLEVCEVDFRVGGRFRMAMREEASGASMPAFGGTYLEIVPDRRIRYDNGFEGGFQDAGERMEVTVDLEEIDGRTHLTLRTVFGSVAMKEAHVGRGYGEGTNSAWDQLAALLVELA